MSTMWKDASKVKVRKNYRMFLWMEVGVKKTQIKKRLVRQCPRCKKFHRWQTEDSLCRKCEKEWVDGYLGSLPENFLLQKKGG